MASLFIHLSPLFVLMIRERMASGSFLCAFSQLCPPKRPKRKVFTFSNWERLRSRHVLTSNELPRGWLESSLRPSLHMVSPIAWTSHCSVLSNQVQHWRKSLELTCEVHPEPALFELLHTQSCSYVMMENATHRGKRRSCAHWFPLTFSYWWCNTVESEISSRWGSLRVLVSWSMLALRRVVLCCADLKCTMCSQVLAVCHPSVLPEEDTWIISMHFFFTNHSFGVTTPLDGALKILR